MGEGGGGAGRRGQRKWAQALETKVWASEPLRSRLEGAGSGNIKLGIGRLALGVSWSWGGVAAGGAESKRGA